MSDIDETLSPDELDEFLRALRDLTERHPRVMREVQVLVDVPETSGMARSSAMVAEANAASRRCDPPCPPGSRCILRAPALQWTCFP